MMDDLIPITEIFVSVSGEGGTAGEIVTFIRTAGCNLRCSYCDTKYSYEPSEYLTIENIINIVKKNKTPKVVLTGGEPLYGNSKRNLALELAKSGLDVYIETNGAVPLFQETRIKNIRGNLHYVIDYKCISSEMNQNDLLDKNINFLNATDEIKFVMQDENDFNNVLYVIEQYKRILSEKKITLLFGTVYGTLPLSRLVELLKENHLFFVENKLKYRLNIQIHKIIWDPNMRGV